MRSNHANLFLLFIILFAFLSITSKDYSENPLRPQAEKNATEWKGNEAYKWARLALEATANNTDQFRPRPTVTSRILSLIFTSMFDAWSRYDDKARPVYLSNVKRVPEGERTLRNKEIAISYAAFRAMNEYYYTDTLLFRKHMKDLGLDPDDRSLDPSKPSGIGNLAAKALIEARRKDGSNQYGDEKGSNGNPYSDYTGYQPVNTPDEMHDENRWQPKYFSDGKGGKFAPGCLTPFWQNVKTFALDSSSEFRPGPPPMIGSAQLEKEVRDVVDMQAHLTNEQKALVEFMRDGPRSVQQAGHWLIFAQDVSRRDKHTLDEDVKMYFAVEAAAMDAFIASWDTKMYYDFARPYALVHHYCKNEDLSAWCGPDKGMSKTKGSNWRPYSPDTFLCPPFPSYVSGHSTVSGACSDILRLFTGSDIFGEEVKRVPGLLTEPDHTGDTITLKFPTFSETAEMAGISRVLGGYHIQADNIEGLKLGRTVARKVWAKYLVLIGS